MPDAAKFDRRMAAQTAGGQPLDWYAVPDPAVSVRGLGFYEKDRALCRLPLPLLPAVRRERPAVEELAYHTAGARLHFCTNSTEVWVGARLSGAAYMSHMTACGQSGFDCYMRRSENSAWVFTGVSKFPVRDSEIRCCLAAELPGEKAEFCVELPLYIGVESVEIGLRAGSEISAAPPAARKAVAFYGTSITQGGCASRPGMAYPAVIGRSMGVEAYNLGFSGNGVGLPCLAESICALPRLSALVVDIEPNAAPEGLLAQNLPAFIDAVRQCSPRLPVLVLSGTHQAAQDWSASFAAQRRAWTELQRAEVEKRRRAGDAHIYFANPETFPGCGTAEITVDGVHLTDHGFALEAAALAPLLGTILKGELSHGVD